MISQTAEYALRAAVVLGNHADRPLTTQEIARASFVPGGYLSKVLQAMGRAGLVEARRGLHGGYVLTRPLDQLTVYDIVNAVDPIKRITQCPLRLSAHESQLCSLHQRLDDAAGMLETYFKQTTIAHLLADKTSPRPGPLCDPPGILSPATGTSSPTSVNP